MVLSSCGTSNEKKEINVAIRLACESILGKNGNIVISPTADKAFAKLARLDARYLPLLISFDDWWQATTKASESLNPKYPQFPDVLVDFCKG